MAWILMPLVKWCVHLISILACSILPKNLITSVYVGIKQNKVVTIGLALFTTPY